RKVVAKQLDQKDSTRKSEWHSKQNVCGFLPGIVCAIKQDEDDQEHRGDHQFQALFRADLVFELTTPLHIVALGHADTFCYSATGFFYKSADVPTTNVHQYSTAQQTVFAADHRGPHHHLDGRNLVQRHLCSCVPSDQHVLEFVNILAEIPCITDPDWESLTTLDRCRHRLPANGGFDHILRICNADSVSRNCFTVYFDFDVGSASNAFSVQINSTGNFAQHPLNLFRLLLNDFQVRSEDLHSDLCANASREHVDSISNWLRPNVGNTGYVQLRIQSL